MTEGEIVSCSFSLLFTNCVHHCRLEGFHRNLNAILSFQVGDLFFSSFLFFLIQADPEMRKVCLLGSVLALLSRNDSFLTSS